MLLLFQFIVDPGTFSFNLIVSLDIIIGSIPLRQSFDTFLPVQSKNLYPSLHGVDHQDAAHYFANPIDDCGIVNPSLHDHYPNLRKKLSGELIN